MEVLEQKKVDDLVFPQDVPLAGADGKQVRYGGLTKFELFTGMFMAAAIQRAGLPPTAEAAQATFNGAVALAQAAVWGLKNYTPPPDPSAIVFPGSMAN